MRLPKISLMFLALTVVLSCGKPLPKLENINLDEWKSDKNGCNGKRAQFIDALKTERTKLAGLNEMSIIELLGKPDQNELYKRNQKFYFYFLQPGALCGNDSIPALRLSVRFNAMGLAKEVMIE